MVMIFIKDYMDFYSVPNLTVDEEKFLFEKMKNGSESARERIIKSHLKLVLKISKNYASIDPSSYFDIVHDGIIGLIESVSKYDPANNARFKTFAYARIRSSIKQGLRNHLNKIKIPKNKINDAIKLLKFITAYEDNNDGKYPSMNEMSKFMSKKSKQIEMLLTVVDILRMKEKSIEDDDILSIDEKSNFYGEIEKNQGMNFILDKIEEMPQIYQNIIFMRYGLNGGKEKTWRQISKEVGISHETARTKHNEAIEMLKNNIL